ncbi:hypothetical protein SEA_CAMERICO_90 [Gordonia phage Camerico]|nr:hypothetical protein SEA_CAMERICO_90 [Gordonia phage Camerico]
MITVDDRRGMMRSEKNHDHDTSDKVRWTAYRGTKSIRAKEKREFNREMRKYK